MAHSEHIIRCLQVEYKYLEDYLDTIHTPLIKDYDGVRAPIPAFSDRLIGPDISNATRSTRMTLDHLQGVDILEESAKKNQEIGMQQKYLQEQARKLDKWKRTYPLDKQLGDITVGEI